MIASSIHIIHIGVSCMTMLVSHPCLSFCQFTVPSGTPGELIVSHSLPTSAQLSWTPVPEDKQNDTITGYIVQVVGLDSTKEIPVMDGNATSYEVSDLRPCTTYTFSVSAMTEASTGPPIIVSSTTPRTGKVLCVYMLTTPQYQISLILATML